MRGVNSSKEVMDMTSRKPLSQMTDDELRALPVFGGADETPEQKAAREKAEADAKAQQGAEYWQAEAKKAFKARDDAKSLADANAAAAKELADLKKSQMTEQEKMQTRIKELEPFETQAKKADELMGKLLEEEMKSVDEKFHSLIPAGTAGDRLLWVKQAKAQGIFGATKVPPVGDRLPDGSGGKTIKRSEYGALPLEQFKKTSALIKKGELVLVEG